MPIDVQGPDGVINRFPDGMADADIEKAMAAQYGAPKASGIGANVKAGFVEGLTGLPDLVQKWVRATFPGAGEAMDAGKALADAALGKSKTFNKLAADQGKAPHVYAKELQGQLHEKSLNAALPESLNPENVSAESGAERIARGAGAGLSGFLLPGGEIKGAGALLSSLKNAAIGAAAGAGGAAASEVAPDSLKPAANVLGAVVSGLATHGAMGAPAAAGRAASGFLEPFGAAVSPEIAQRAAGRQLAEAASDPAAVRAALDQPGEIVPGSEPTTFQQTGDMGLGGLERGVATRNPERFAQRRAEQNTARTQALSEIQQGADPNDVAKALKGQFDDLNAVHDAEVDTATDAAAGKSAAMGAEVTPEGAGASVRNAVTDRQATAKAAEGKLWEAVDPNRNLIGNAGELKEAAARIEGEVPATAKPMDGEEAAIFAAVAEMPKLAPLQDVIALRSRVSTAMREARKAGDDQAGRRLTQLRGHIESNLSDSIAHQIAQDDAAVGRGMLSPDDTTLARLNDWANRWTDQGAGRGGAVAGAVGEDTRGATARVPGVAGSEREAGSRSGDAAGAARVSPELERARDDVNAYRAGQSGNIGSAIADLGGMRVRDAKGAAIMGPDIAGAIDDLKIPGMVNGRGLSPEQMAQALADRGWFGPNIANPSLAMEEALGRQARGERVYHPTTYEPGHSDRLRAIEADLAEAGVGARDHHTVAARKLADYRGEFADVVKRAEALGIDPNRPMQEVVGDVLEREAIQNEGGPAPDPHGEEFDRLSGRVKQPTVDDGAKGRLDAANKATKERHETFDPLKAITREKGAKGDYALPNGEVPRKFFRPGVGGYEAMQSLLKAAPEALEAMVDYAATSLRRVAADAMGVIDAKKFETWAKAHKDALRAFPPEVRAKFADAAKAGETVADALAAKTAALKDAQSGALGKVMNLSTAEDVTKTVGQILNGRTAVADMKALAKATSGNPVARAGLRQAVADFIAQKLIGNTEAGTSGGAQIKADAYQTFFKEKRAALNLIFKPDEVASMDAIARDIQRSKRSENAVKLPGGSNTAQDQIAARRGKLAQQGGRTVLDALGGFFGAHFGGPVGAVAGVVGTHLLQSFRASGITKIDELVTEAMLHPEVARELLKKAPALSPNRTRPLAAALRTAQRSAFAAVQSKQANP